MKPFSGTRGDYMETPIYSGDGWLKSRFGPGEHREFFLAGVFGSMLGTPLRGRIVSPKDEFHLG